MNVCILGHVDHGKSTLIGRLLYETGSLPDGKFEQIQASCRQRGMPFEWSFLMDALQLERDQGITVDASQIGFTTQKRGYAIIDAPGHKEFLRNMISGAAASEAALLIIDAKEGMKEQSRRHAFLLHLLGVRQIAVLVNKMDAAEYSKAVFFAIEAECHAYLTGLELTPSCVIPVSAREGDNLLRPSAHMPWYMGKTVVEALDGFSPAQPTSDLPLRLPVQDVYKFDERRIIVGRIESGKLRVGDTLLFSPGGQAANVASIEAWPDTIESSAGHAGQSLGITLAEQIFVERGHIASHETKAPLLTNRFRAKLFWLGTQPLKVGKQYKIKLCTCEIAAEIKAIEQVIDTETLAQAPQSFVSHGEVAEVLFRTRGLVAVDAFSDNPHTGRFVIIEDYDICGGGIIDMKGFTDQRVAGKAVKSKNIATMDLGITSEERTMLNGHKGGVLWLTGLSGAGKSTLAVALQRHLFAKGCQTYVLDGDNLRGGLSSDLEFSAEDRSENIRRAGEVAALFAQAGMIVIASFISPYHKDRLRAQAASAGYFSTIYIKAELGTCEMRDPKGLYKKARKGEIIDFTGISAPYEEPENPDLVIDTGHLNVGESLTLLLDYVKKEFFVPV